MCGRVGRIGIGGRHWKGEESVVGFAEFEDFIKGEMGMEHGPQVRSPEHQPVPRRAGENAIVELKAAEDVITGEMGKEQPQHVRAPARQPCWKGEESVVGEDGRMSVSAGRQGMGDGR